MDSTNLGSSLAVRRHEIQVVMVPLPVQGHLNQLLHLSRAIAARGLNVLFVSTSTHIHQARHRVQGWNPDNFSIRFHELPVPSFPDAQADPENTEHMFPVHLIPVLEALEGYLREPFDRLMQNLCMSHMKGIVIVHDPLLGWVQTVAAKYESPAYVFNCVSAFFSAVSQNVTEFPECVVSVKRCFPERFINYISRQADCIRMATGHLVNSFRFLESQFLDALLDLERQPEDHGQNRLWAVGPLLPQSIWTGKKGNSDVGSCLRWLDGQAPGSVVYVSFGTMSSLSRQQLLELARGLEASQRPFLWVVGVADRARSTALNETQMDWISELLPEGYESRIAGRGLLVKNWAPQLDILSHESTGGFVTHCGWNSTLEGISAGVPMVGWPLHSDQYANSILVARKLKVGVEVKNWMKADEYELVTAEEVEKAIRRVMGEDEEAREMRRRAKEFKEAARRAVGKEGSSCNELESFINHFTFILNEQNSTGRRMV
uniref:Glycosyltransferase n=1 Tax=Pinus tabuliformis TaxID=88731 RepID=A0A0K0M7E7_PINTB|nr:UGT73C [Pinus tabuliformis]